jgi:hypothetical protein
MGQCYTVSFELTQGQADSLTLLLVKSSGASVDTTGRIFLDDEFLGYLAEADDGPRCEFHLSSFNVQLTAGSHDVRVCTSLYPYQHGTELDDYAFYDLRLIFEQGVPVLPDTWGSVKTRYLSH